jgi:peptidoglycan/LPS O-acetylase OafA/YrhL
MKRITVLDGWRGIAIALVLVDHIQHSLLRGYLRPWTQTGQHGVTIFFVLSGFLITSKLLEGPINLRRFYIRRFFRLMPAAWTYLAALGLLGLILRNPLVSFPELGACVFFYRNFFTPSVAGLTGHFWSLSLEEQFYLFWPCMLLAAGRRRCRWIAGGGAIACAIYRWIFWAHYDRNVVNGQSQVRADALLAGCLLALLFLDPRLRAAAARLAKWWVLPAAAVLVYCIATFVWLPPLAECVSAASLIAATVLHPRSILARPFAFAPLAWLGTVSYSVYVWQEVFTPFRNPYVWFIVMPLFALGSYYGIERPATNLGHRLSAEPAASAKAAAEPLAQA